MIDTPGFDDTQCPDLDILRFIVKCVQDVGPLSAVIYLHRIIDKRVTGNARLNFHVLQSLCGAHFFPRVLLATTMWETLPEAALHKASLTENELLQTFWKEMDEGGARYFRYHRTPSCRNAMLAALSKQPEPLNLAVELELLRGAALEYTGAGSVLTAELRHRERKRRRDEEDEIEEEMSRTKDELRVISSRNKSTVYQHNPLGRDQRRDYGSSISIWRQKFLRFLGLVAP